MFRHHLIAALLLTPGAAAAHGGAQAAPGALGWSWDPLVLVPLLASAVLYARGSLRLRRASRNGGPGWREAAFAAGWISLAAALVSPLDAMGEQLFAAHMVQHEVVMLVAAPLLVLGAPLARMVWALPPQRRAAAGRWLGAGWGGGLRRGLGRPAVAFCLYGLTVWLWHLPGPYQAAVRETPVHLAQHLSFLATAVLFWWSVLDRRHGVEGSLAGALYVFATAAHNGVLGAFLTFTGTAWYPVYAETAPSWGLSAVADQQLGGLIMWVPSGVVYLLACLALTLGALRGVAASARRRAAERDRISPLEREYGSWKC